MAIVSIDGCIGCRECVDACPVDVIRFDDENKIAVITYKEDCQICNQCVIYCPVDAITITNDRAGQLTLSW